MRQLAGLFIATTLLAAPLRPAAAETVLGLSVPREHAYWIGDVLTHRAILALPEGYQLDRSTLPRPRSVTYWLDLKDVAVSPVKGGDEQALEITTRYQTFYAPLEPKRREVPAYLIRLNGPDGFRDLEVPAWSFVTSPIRPILAPASPGELRPDDRYAPIDARRAQIATVVSALLGLVGLLGLVWHQAWPPFHRRAARPLTAAYRQVRRVARSGQEDRLRLVCFALHRGLDGAFKRPLLGADLDSFLAARSEFVPLQAPLQRFFAISGTLFFAAPNAQDQAASDIARSEAPMLEIVDLAKRLAAVERGRL